MHNWAIKNGIIRDDLVMLLMNAMFRHFDRAESNRRFMRTTIMLCLFVFLSGGVVPWLTCVSIVLYGTRGGLSCIGILKLDNNVVANSDISELRLQSHHTFRKCCCRSSVVLGIVILGIVLLGSIVIFVGD